MLFGTEECDQNLPLQQYPDDCGIKRLLFLNSISDGNYSKIRYYTISVCDILIQTLD